MFSSNHSYVIYVDFTDINCIQNKDRYLSESLQKIKNYSCLPKEQSRPLHIIITYADYSQIFDLSIIYSYLKLANESDNHLSCRITMDCACGYTVQFLQAIHKTLSDIFPGEQLYFNLDTHSVVFCSKSYVSQFILGKFSQGEPLSPAYQEKLNQEVYKSNDNYKYQKHLVKIFKSIINHKNLIRGTNDEQNNTEKRVFIVNPCNFDEYTNYVEFYDIFLKENIDINKYIISSTDVEYEVKYYLPIKFDYVYVPITTNTVEDWVSGYTKNRTHSKFQIFNLSIGDTYEDGIQIDNVKYYLPIVISKLKTNSPCYIDINISERNSNLSRIERLISCLPAEILNRITINKSPISRPPLEASDIFPIIILKSINDLSNNDTFESIEKKYFDYISNYENYKGTDENIIRETVKKDISNLITTNVIEKQENMSHLAYIIFLYMLRNLLERKELFNTTARPTPSNVDKSTNGVKKYIREDIIDKAFVDAQSYANGIFQLIENACEHSCGRQAVFGMRIHNADRNAPPSSFEKETKTLAHLMAKYNDKNVNNMFYNRIYSDYIEFFVLDDATNYQGIVPKFNHSVLTGNGICEIEDIIQLTEQTYEELAPSNSDLSLYYTQHYGLRWFEQIVSKNNGLFMISSPNESSTSYYPTKRNVENTNVVSYFTEYNILIPLSYAWEMPDQSNTNTPEINIVSDEDIQSENITFLSISNSEWHNIFFNNSDKSSRINLAYDYFESVRSGQTKFKWYIDFCNKGYHSVEILAKSLFKLIFQLRYNSDKRVLIAIDFGNQHAYVSEFVRIFAIFYGKLGNNSYMENIQIALCSESKLDNNNKEVNFVIAGKDILSAHTTADTFLYYNSESTYKYTHLLRYLVGDLKNKTDIKPISIFPFDLYLKNQQHNECWFLDRMKSVLNNDISEYPYGCKISNTHIRISSRIHLNDFYEAELLFHNLGNVYRFAYLIASDILKSVKDNHECQPILLVGYENYSAILVQQIKKFIGQSGSKIICAALVVEGEKNETHLEIVSGDLPQKEPQKLLCYTIVPITTTMSTVYKIHNIVEKNIQQRELDRTNVVFERNYSIIAVCDRLETTQKDTIDFSDKDIPYCYYWSSISPCEKIVYLKPESKSSDSCSVKYYLSAASKWNDSENCKINAEHIDEYSPLIQVDKTSTLPKSIFELKENNRKKAFKTNYTDSLRLSALKPQFKSKKARVLLRYSHLCRGNNHYQFYFDFDKYVETRKETIITWAKQIKLDRNSYNIVISPLSISNSQFLHIILEMSFVSSLRFLHIDITNTYKDDARAKFSYIAKEIESIRLYNPNAIFNFYFVDDSIVTGNTLNRARTIMRMIIDQAGIGTTNVALFKKIFLLINRSSYETMNTYVENPQEDVYAYLNLMIPSYNTTENLCPACYVQQRYQLLRKRSATLSLSRNFARLEQKHNKNSSDKYDQWLEQEIINNHSYFAWLKLWLYYFPHDEHNENLGSPKGCEELKNDIIDFMKKQVSGIDCSTLEGEEAYLSLISMLNLKDFLCQKPQKESFVVELMKYIVAERAYVRLETMNKAYNTLFDVVQTNNATDYSDLVDITAKRILSLLNECCSNSKMNYYGKFETIISYIKVISREHLSNYYHIRTAIVQVMLNLLNILNGEAVEPDYSTIAQTIRYNHCGERSFSTTPCASLQYQLFTTICHRLALLQCSIVYEPQFVNSIFNRYTDLRQKYFGETYDLNCAPEYSLQLTELLPSNQVAERYAASIKTATMLTNDDSACYNLLSNFEKIPDDNEMICQIKKVLKLENTRVFFDFMRELDERLNRERCGEKYTGEGGLKHRYTLLSKEENEIDTIINESIQGNEILKQNPFSKYIRFWQRYYNLFPNIADVDTIHSTFTVPITKMFHYFRTVRYLSEMSYENLAHMHNNLPYLYEDICISMADVTNHQMCYIFTKNKRDMEIQKISQSGYHCGEDAFFQDEMLLTKSFAQLLNSIDACDHCQNLINININSGNGELKGTLKHVMDCIYSFSISTSKDNNKCILPSIGKIISLPYSLQAGDLNGESCFYIVLQEYTCLENNSALNGYEDMEKILFLRDSLMQILQRDYAVLINFRYDCSYIKSLSNVDFNEKSTGPSILHISDIHIDGTPTWQRDGNNTNKICQKLSEAMGKVEAVPDLIAITGDIIQGSSHAMCAQDRYEMVSDYLKKIVLVLWKHKYQRVPHDWKRRILIVPGNHDYLTMNELSAVSKSRKTRYAEPVLNRNGSTMVKFTYYIEFLQKFLDSPIDRLVANGLNEVRDYDNLKTTILLLNSVAVANSLQNNKVGFEFDSIREIISSSQWMKKTATHICISHHAKSYDINYMKDIYSTWKIIDEARKINYEKEIKELIDCFDKLLDVIFHNNSQESIITEYLNCYEKCERRIKDSKLFIFEMFEDMQQIYDLLRLEKNISQLEQDEFSLQLKSRLFTMKKMACDDSQNFVNSFEKIEKCISPQKIIYLAGHVHECVPKEKEVALDTTNEFIIGKAETCFSIVSFNSKESVKRILFEF